MSTEPTNEGKRLIEEWQAAVKDLASHKSRTNSLECHMHNTRNALGKWLMPNDAQMGEKFSIWYGDSLISASCEGNGHDFEVTIRSRGKALR